VEGGTAWKLVGGFRPIRVVGVEIQYLDFGDGDESFRSGGGGQIPRQLAEASASSDATVVSATFFIPERVQTADFYAKLGMAHLDDALQVSGYDANGPGCVPAIPNCAFDLSVETSDSVPYVGLGARFTVGPATGVRVEFEAIDRDAGDATTLLSVGVAWER
jgi:hypothetical protein